MGKRKAKGGGRGLQFARDFHDLAGPKLCVLVCQVSSHESVATAQYHTGRIHPIRDGSSIELSHVTGNNVLLKNWYLLWVGKKIQAPPINSWYLLDLFKISDVHSPSFLYRKSPQDLSVPILSNRSSVSTFSRALGLFLASQTLIEICQTEYASL